MDNKLVILDFSSIYEEESFYNNKQYAWVDFRDIVGADCFCVEETKNKIVKQLSSYNYNSIHFIDNGNYHYVSKFWTDKIDQDFVLIVFDHHSDIQLSNLSSSFLTCGSWIYYALKENPHLKKVVLIGVSNPIDIKNNPKVEVIYQDEIDKTEVYKKLCEIKEKYPVYISIDKDVLSRKDFYTNWDQGTMDKNTFKELLDSILRNDEVLGIDLCGECEEEIENLTSIEKDDVFNKNLLEFIMSRKK